MHCGHAVIGDTRYGQNDINTAYKRLGLNRMYLHASVLSFEWRGETQEFSASVDDNWLQAVTALSREQ